MWKKQEKRPSEQNVCSQKSAFLVYWFLTGEMKFPLEHHAEQAVISSAQSCGNP
jgi:hypothetical protein